MYCVQISLTTGWTVRRSNPRGGEIFRTCPDRPWGPPSLLYNGYRVFPVGKERPGRDADPSPSFSAVVKKEYTYTPTPRMGRTACTEPRYLYKGAFYPFYRSHIKQRILPYIALSDGFLQQRWQVFILRYELSPYIWNRHISSLRG